jgi:hypothetical protein
MLTYSYSTISLQHFQSSLCFPLNRVSLDFRTYSHAIVFEVEISSILRHPIPFIVHLGGCQ